MMEVFVLVPANSPVWTKILSCLAIAATVTTAFFMLMTGNIIFLPLCAIFGGAWYFLSSTVNREYEYSYFDGEVRFARIVNKSRRKQLKTYSMDEVVKIAPAGDSSVSRFENDHNVSVKDFTSGKKQNPYYEMVVKDSEKYVLYKLELDDKYLDAICMKYASKVVRRAAV